MIMWMMLDGFTIYSECDIIHWCGMAWYGMGGVSLVYFSTSYESIKYNSDGFTKIQY